jgi:hypothetical protein
LVVVMAPTSGLTQRPGGFGGGGGFGGRGFDPNAIFDMMAKGRNYIEISEVDPSRRERYIQYAQQNGITDGRLTREQFSAMMQARMASGGMGGGFGGTPGGGTPGGGFPMGGSPPTGGPPSSCRPEAGDRERGSDRDRGGDRDRRPRPRW